MPRPSKWKYYMMWVVVHTIGVMPLKYRYAISRFMSDRVYSSRPSVRRALRSNVRHVLGPEASGAEVDRIARQCARNTGRYYADIVGMHRMDMKRFFEEDLDLQGLEHIQAALAQGRGVVFASAHYANPEFAAQGLAGIGIQIFGLVEPLNPPELGKLMYGLRTVHGHRYEEISFGGIKDALTWLRKGGVVCILIDRDIQNRGMELELCGAKARFPTGAADLALRTNSALIPGWARRVGDFKIYANIGPELEMLRTGNHDDDVRINSQRLLDLFEIELKKDPGQWSTLAQIWPD